MLYYIIEGNINLSLIILLFTVLSSYFILDKIIIFNPFSLFSYYYYFVIFSCLYLVNTNFDNNMYISMTKFSINESELMLRTLVYLTLCYIFTYFGYKAIKKNFIPSIELNDNISMKTINITILIFSLIGLSNFIINIFKFSSGNILDYFTNISIRQLEFETLGGTTLGYWFVFLACYLWFYKILKYKNKNEYFIFILYLLLSIIMKASLGRITDTIFYVLSFFVIYYFININTQLNNHRRYFILLLLLLLMAVLFFFFRFTSSLSYNDMLNSSFLSTILDFFTFDTILLYIVDNGNIPNIPILMKIIDSWEFDIGFLYGESLFSWLYGFFPSDIRPDRYQVSFLIKDIWFDQIDGGSLPPTGMGEMFANFGYIGGLWGMFLFGVIIAFIYNLLYTFNNYWYLLIFVNITLNFITIFPKGEVDNLSVLLIIPYIFLYVFLIFFQSLLRSKFYSKGN
ncbi:oligosaccharide repeat unit polymerase [Arcobacter lacus]|uniref:O-antigen polymerase n=1 Tax=Arcobacter lacus TaxID=1912876 RepID=UPI0021BAEF62|nr:O-antigen polymerase [Arcobacter lacus]MCT7911789.1 oligosaccharide repeat unit polymerase [Arcobacter lacus]